MRLPEGLNEVNYADQRLYTNRGGLPGSGLQFHTGRDPAVSTKAQR